MRVKWWHISRGRWLAVVIAAGLLAGTSSLAAEPETKDYDANDCCSIGRACSERGEYEEALKWFDRGLALEPEDVHLYDGKATALLALGALEEAAAYWDRALALRPDDWYMRSMKGTILWIQDQPEEAVESYDRALELYDGGYTTVLRDYDLSEVRIKAILFNFHVARAMALSKIGRLEEAVESFDRALALKPEDLFSRILVGGVPADPTWPAQATETYHGELFELDDKYPSRFADIYEEAVKAFLVFVHNEKAEVLRELGRLEEAVDAYDGALKLRPEDWVSHLAKAEILVELGRPEEALECYDRAIELEPGESCIYIAKTDALEELGKLAEVVESYDKALALKPDDWFTHYRKAETLVELGRLEEAVESYDRAIDVHYDERASLLTLAFDGKIEALKDLGRLEDALEAYNEALTRDPEDEGLALGKVEVLLELGRYEEVAQSDELSAVTLGLPLSGPTTKAGTTPMKEARVEVGTPAITGAAVADTLRSSAVIARIVNQRKAGIGDIYKKYLEADPNLEGELVVRFTVAASGAVTACSVVSSTLGNTALDREVCDCIAAWRFPPIDAGDVDVACPCVFFLSHANYVEGGAGLPATERYEGRLKKKRVSVAGTVTSIGGEAAAEAQRSPQVIAPVIRRHLAGIQYVYNSALKENPNLGSGKVTVRFTILASGSVGVASIATNTLGSPALSKGILARVRGWRFPKVESGSVTVVYDFVFAVSDW